MNSYKAQLQLTVSIECDVQALNQLQVQNYISEHLLSGNLNIDFPENFKMLNLESGKLKVKKLLA